MRLEVRSGVGGECWGTTWIITKEPGIGTLQKEILGIGARDI